MSTELAVEPVASYNAEPVPAARSVAGRACVEMTIHDEKNLICNAQS